MSHQKLNAITVVLVLILFGTVCSSYAIDCMDLWDEESIAEMIEDDKHYEEKRKARQLEEGDHWDDEHEYDNEDEDEDHHEDDDEDAITDHEEGNDEDDEAEEHEPHDEAHDASTSHTETRYKRQLTLTAEQRQQQQRPASAAVEEVPSADLEVAETHLFRPVFRYKSQYTERRRVRDNFTPSRQ